MFGKSSNLINYIILFLVLQIIDEIVLKIENYLNKFTVSYEKIKFLFNI